MTRWTLLLAFAAPIVGCDRDKPADSARTNPQPGVTQAAIERLANARCNKLAACGNIGQGREHPDKEHCLAEQRAKRADDFSDCSTMQEVQLQKCEAEINAERCDDLADAIDRLATCRKGNLCVR
jgi:hypothetical protein